MALQYELTDQPGEDLKAFYKEVDGKFVLDVEGVVPQSKVQELESKVAEFRTNNVELKRKLEAVGNVSLKDKDPSSIDVEALLESRVGEMKTHFTTQVSKLTEENQKLNAHLERVVLSDSVKEAALKYGVLESALPDVLNRAKDTFVVKDGVAVSKAKAVDKDGKPMGVTAWIQSLAEAAPHLFAQSRGSGAVKPVRTGGVVQGDKSSIEKISDGLNKLK